MENASKALIIAGAILISILLISVGVLIMNSTDSVTGQVGGLADTQAVQTFNAQFTAYEGKDKQPQQIRQLFSTIKASNAKNAQQVTITKASGKIIDSSASVTNNKKYTVTLGYDDAEGGTGYVNSVTITEQ